MNRTPQQQEEMKERKPKKARNHVWKIFVLFLCPSIVLATIIYNRIEYHKTHFDSNTIIQNVDCSHLTVEQAQAKIENTIKQSVSFTVIALDQNGNQSTKQYMPTKQEVEEIGLSLDASILEQILSNQHEEKEIDTNQISFYVNETALKTYLSSIPELQEENMVMAQNAYLQLGEDLRIQIVPETIGNQVDLEEACRLATEQLKNGNAQISFEAITTTQASITKDSKELQSRQKEINDILSTTVRFPLTNGETVILDDSIMKDWIKPAEGIANVIIEVEPNLQAYIEELDQKVDKANTYMTFPATDVGNMTIYVGKWARASLDKEKEKEHILSLLGNAKENEAELIYDRPLIVDLLDNHIEVDLTRQTVWVYKDGECILETPCVTGKPSAGNDTPTGVYFLSYKTTNAVLKGYNSDGSLAYASPVKYWMPFNGGIGFHDASWQSSFGGSRYLTHGSHGCVNLPFASAKTLYENINTNMPIIVYES